ncbi:FtsX-like permease family protein [Pseudactinotalea sp.]|uniref:FtsX-like permease family protein n=1 Tax=Pseudactinotalea sp. TaxID=1926260 RepID=UPI003B3BD7BF
MRTSGYAWRRSRARAGLVALLTAMSSLVVLALAGTLAYLDVSSTAGVREAIAASPPTARIHQVQTRLADDPAQQHADSEAVLDRLLPAGALTWSAIRTPPLPLADSEARAVLVVDEEVGEHAALSEGAWPAAADQTAVHAAVAESLGLSIGDVVEVTAEDSAAELTVVGTWLPADADATHWFGDAMLATGVDPLNADSYGPFLVTTEALTPLAVAPFVQWSITPGAELSPETLDDWLSALPLVAERLSDEGLTVRGVTTSGTLTGTLADAREGLASVRASSAIPLLIVALVSLVALWQITRLLAAMRERETLVLLSRGAAPGQILRIGAAEAVVVAAGALIGGVAVTVAFAGRAGFDLGTTVLVTAGAAIAVLAVMIAAVWRATASGLRPEGESGRATAALTGSAFVLVSGFAAFALWRFTRNGSPLVPGTRQIDIIAVGAPALALIAIALAAVVLAAPLSRALASLAARRRGFSPVTELRQSSRRTMVNAVPVVLVVLAAAIATIASSYAGTWQALRTASAQVSVGADVRVETGGGVASQQPRGVLRTAEAAGVDAATGVLQAPLRIDDRVGRFTALPILDVGVSSAPATLVDPVVPLLTPPQDPLPGLDLPDDAQQLTVDVTASALGEPSTWSASRSVELRVWMSQGAELIRVTVGTLTVEAADLLNLTWDEEENQPVETVLTNPDKGEPVSAELTANLPPGRWRVVAVDTVMGATLEPTAWQVEVSQIAVDGADLLADSTLSWDPTVRPMPGGSGDYAPEGTLAFSGEFVGDTVGPTAALVSTAVQRFMPEATLPLTVPVVTTAGWNDTIRPAGTDVLIGSSAARLEQVGTIAVVPGNPDPAAALADLPTLQNVLLRTADDVLVISQVWLSSGARNPVEVADEVRSVLGPRVEVVATGERVTDAVAAPARAVYWVAALCALLLALPAIAAVAATQASARRGEVVVLRAIGVGAAQQARSRTRELLGLELGATAAGLLAGWLISHLVMVPLIRSTAPQVSRAVPLQLTFDWLPGLAMVAAVVVTVGAVAFWYGLRVRAQSRDTTWREEIR